MTHLEEIMKSKIKPKEKTALLAEKLIEDKGLLKEIYGGFSAMSVGEKGTCIEAIGIITKDDPKFADGCLEFVIDQIGDDGPRVKWESAQVVSNVAKTYPDRTAKAIPALLDNTENDGTVVRWSAAKGLTEIAINNQGKREQLIKSFNEILKREDNNGVKNIYLKALKKMEKGKK